MPSNWRGSNFSDFVLITSSPVFAAASVAKNAKIEFMTELPPLSLLFCTAESSLFHCAVGIGLNTSSNRSFVEFVADADLTIVVRDDKDPFALLLLLLFI